MTRQRLLTIAAAVLLSLGVNAQSMKGRIYYNGNMSVAHLLPNKSGETPEARAERERMMDEIFTLSVTAEFPDSYKVKVKMRIMTDKERAAELGVSWGNRKLWETQLTVAAKTREYWSHYRVEEGCVVIEDGTKMCLNEDESELMIDDSQMHATLKRIK